jgi:hypothetical protein
MNNNKTTSNKNEIPKISNGVNKFFQSKTFKRATLGVAAFIILLIVFGLGTFVGFRKANFSYQWGENYHQNFAGPRGGFFGDFGGRDFINAHGVIGQIIKIDPSTGSTSSPQASSGQAATLVLKGMDNIEKIILIKDDTIIERLRETLKPADLKVDDTVVVIGQPNEAGQIEAKFIRIMPPQPGMPPGSPRSPIPQN